MTAFKPDERAASQLAFARGGLAPSAEALVPWVHMGLIERLWKRTKRRRISDPVFGTRGTITDLPAAVKHLASR